jgi:predicted permease
MKGWLDDLRYSVRSLLGRPALAMVAVLTLALGIGANTAIFSVLHGLFLAPLPYPQGERLVDVHNSYPTLNLNYAGTSIPDYIDRREQAAALEDLALYTGISLNLADAGTQPERLVGLRATPSLFSTLGVPAVIGRVFDDEHGVPGQDKVVVLSHALWRNRFGADPGVVGRDVRLSGEPYRVLGVMPEGFRFPSASTQLWVPFAITEAQRADTERGQEFSRSVGRLRPGASIEQLNAELDAIVANNADRIGSMDGELAAGFAEFLRAGNFIGRAQSLRELQVGDVRPMVLILQVAVALVLLIAAANVANLLLTRLNARQKELAVRNALGASRARIARQLLMESLLIALAGFALGTALALLLIELLPLIGLDANTTRYPVGIDSAVLGFAFLISLLTGALAALLPMLSLMANPVSRVIHDSGRLSGGGRLAGASRGALVVAQVTLATVLLVGAGLLLRSFVHLQQASPGFEAKGVLTALIALPSERYPDASSRSGFFESVLREARTIPGVDQASITSQLPFSGDNSQGSYSIEGLEVADASASPHGLQRYVDEAFFDTLRIPLLRGRTFSSADHANSEPVVIIDELLARKYFDGKDPIGQRINRTGDSPWANVVGVVGTVKHGSLMEVVNKETLYWPFRQSMPGTAAILLRGPGVGAASTADGLRTAVRRVDPEQPVFNMLMLDERIALSLQQQRAPMNLLGGFAAVALLLSAIGIYAVLAFSVGQRSGELGVRMAIGAGSRQIQSLVLVQGARLAAIGLGIGILLSLLLGRLAQSQLFGVSAWDPLTYLLVPPFLAGVAMLACWLPALRASRIDPMLALRRE